MAETVPEELRASTATRPASASCSDSRSSAARQGGGAHHAVGHCYRCHTVVEPRLSEQWFVRMAPLAKPALAAYREGRLRFIPERRARNTPSGWRHPRLVHLAAALVGHRIPVWYCDACGKTHVSRTDLATCPCGAPLRQDEDVLDTWFSSWLVPFSSLGWPEQTKDLAAFYPGTVLVTAPEILFFWVARMVMAGCEFMGDIPFSTVYLHGTVRDTQHRRCPSRWATASTDRGGGALRRRRAALHPGGGHVVGTDVILDPKDLESTFAAGRNFANKLWNAAGSSSPTSTGPRAGSPAARARSARRS